MEIIAFLLAALNAQDAPPIRTVLPATPPAQQFLQWIAQDARCGGMTVSARSLHQPRPMLVGGAMQTLVPVTVRFRIDGDGRPLSIRRDEGGNAYLGTDIVPSLAASTFAIDAPQNGCTMRYLPVRTPLDVVDRQTLFAYAMIPGTPPLPRETWQRLQPPTADCADRPGPRVRSRAYPDFFSFPGSRGNRDWAMMQYDLNARGRPINVTVSDHSGNAALNAASIRAVRDSRFTPGARTGCVYRY